MTAATRSPRTESRPRRALQRAAVLLGAAAVAFATAQAPASASASQCADNRLCAWSDNDHAGIFTAYTASAQALGGDNDRFVSLWNRNSVSWWMYVDAYYGGPSTACGLAIRSPGSATGSGSTTGSPPCGS